MKIVNIESDDKLEIKEKLLNNLKNSTKFFAVFYPENGVIKHGRYNMSNQEIIANCELLKHVAVQEELE